MTNIAIVQASHVLSDADVLARLPSLTAWAKLVTDAYGLEPVFFSLMPLITWLRGSTPPRGPIPVFLNRHSTEPGDLGFHDVSNGRPYGRSFSGDDLLDRIDPWVTLSHEIAEILVNPFVREFITLLDGSRTVKEICDPVEDDIQAIEIDGCKWSNFVLPPYWATEPGPPGTRYAYSQGNFAQLAGPCPALTPGGYLPILRPGASAWTQIVERHLIGGTEALGVRAQRFRGSLRHRMLEAAGSSLSPTVQGASSP